MIDNGTLIDLGFKGNPFTWRHNSRSCATVAKRLDRALVDLNWRLAFPEALVFNIFSSYSDHNPIGVFLCRFEILKGDHPFCYEAAWTCHPMFNDAIKEAWKEHDHDLSGRLLSVKDNTLKFNKKIFLVTSSYGKGFLMLV